MEGLKIGEAANQVGEFPSATTESAMMTESAASMEPLELTVSAESIDNISKIAEKILQLEESSVIETVTIQEQSQKAQISQAPAKAQDLVAPSSCELEKASEQPSEVEKTPEQIAAIEKALETLTIVEKAPEATSIIDKVSEKCESIEKVAENVETLDQVAPEESAKVEKPLDKPSKEKSPEKQEKIPDAVPTVEETGKSSSVKTIPEDPKKTNESSKVEEPEKLDKPQTML